MDLRVGKQLARKHPLAREYFVRIVVGNPTVCFESQRFREWNIEIRDFAGNSTLQERRLESAYADLRAFDSTKRHYDEQHSTHIDLWLSGYRVRIKTLS